MFDFQSLNGDGLTEFEAMNTSVEVLMISMLKNRLSSLYFDKDKLHDLRDIVMPDHPQQKVVYEAMAMFSKRERQCFLLHTVQNMSFGSIAAELRIHRGTVQKYIERAKKKIQNQI